ncbi:Metabotropic glutamate receptor 3 [Mizuhopecten yessoensis]|uniref:Metabotropic glutamate receptor 3 n=2 Tax=Mizuhopecten yessoensis TaxID=6573 RepID=A0A210QJ60_MIZYE|nr:Metabotropic glutamate receptor 3 [Mizuhopecten yessoensis]
MGDHCRDRTISANGTLNFAVIANLHETSAGKYCGSISTKGFQTAIAIEWITNILSSYIPGITLGFDIYDDCGLPSMATDAILDVLPGGKPADLLSCDDTASKSTFTGIIAMTTVEASMALADVVEPDTPFISGHARSPTLELKDNILFTVPSFKEEVKAAFQLMATLRWYYVVIVHTDEDIGKLYLEEFELQRKETKVCVGGIKEISIKYTKDVNIVKTEVKKLINYLENQQSHTLLEQMGVVYVGGTVAVRHIIQSIIDEKSTQARSLQWIMLADIKTDSDIISMIEKSADKLDIFMLTVSPHDVVNLSTFKNYFIDRLLSADPDGSYSPWLDKYMAKVYPDCGHNCNRLTVEQGFRQDINSVSAVIAVMALASAIKRVHYEHCGNESGVCLALQDKKLHLLVMDKLKSTSIPLHSSFTHLPQELSSLNTSIMIMDRHFHIDGTEMVNFFKYNSSTTRVVFDKIGYLSPNFHVANNMFSICKDECGPCVQEEEVEFGYVDGDIIILGLFSIRESQGDFGCGGYRDDDQAIVTALAFIQTIKQLPLIGGKRIGGLALDDCYSSLNISHFLTELFSGKRKLKFKTSGSEQIIDMSKVRFAVGAVSSDVTLVVADLLTHLNIPMVSYGASSSFLDNRRMYPYFLRTVPSDKLQVDGIVDVLTYLDFSFVGAIYLDDAYGYNGILDVEKKANDNGICIINKQKVTGNYLKYPQIEETLQQNVVDVVVFYGISTVAKEMLDDFEDSYIFIASEAWGKDPDLITQQTGPKSRGSLVFQTDTTFHTDNYLQKYLMSISPQNDTGLPWVEHLWENLLKCDFPWSIDKRFTNRVSNDCSMNARINQTYASHLSDYQRVVHISHAVNAIWTGCNKSTICMTQTVDRAFAEQLTNAIKNVKLTQVEGTPFKLFKDDGNGFMGLSIFNIQHQQDNKYVYKKVGTFSEEGHLNLELDQIKFYDSFGNPVQAFDVKATCKPDLCSNICQLAPPANNTTMAPATDRPVTQTSAPTDDSAGPDIIVMGVVIGLMFVVLLLLIVLLFRQHTTNKQISSQKMSMQSRHTTSSRSLDNMYEDIGSSRGNSNQGFETHNFNSRDFRDGSCGDSSSLTTKKTSSVEYSDVVQSLPDLTKPTAPRTASSSASGSGGDASSVPSRGSRATEKNSSGMSDTSGPSSLGDRTHLNYVSAKELALVDEDVLATPPPSYLELRGAVEANANPLQNSTLQRRLLQAQNRNAYNPMQPPENIPLSINTAELTGPFEANTNSPQNSTLQRRSLQPQSRDTSNPIKSPEHAPLPINSTEVFRANRPQTLPGISPEQLSNLQFVHHPSTHLQSPQLQPPPVEQQQAMYLHALPQDHHISTSPHQFKPVSQPESSHMPGQGTSPNQLYLLANHHNRESAMYLDPVPQNTNIVHNGGYAPQSSPVVLFDQNGVPHIYTESNLAQYPRDSPVNTAPQQRPIPIKPVTQSPVVYQRAAKEPNQTYMSHQSNVPLQYPIGQNNDPRQQRQLSPSYLDDDDGEVIII